MDNGENNLIPRRDMKDSSVNPEVLKYVPEESASYYGIIPIDMVDGVLEVGIVDPENIEATNAISFIATKLGVPYKIFQISQIDFDSLVVGYKNLTGEVGKALKDLATGEERKTDKVTDELLRDISGKNQQVSSADDAPITKIVGVLIQHAVEGRASDIHIEPTADKIKVRFRVDGILNTSIILPGNVHDAVIARIKILSNMKLDEKRVPQDGRFSATIEKRVVDFRVSTFPTYYGEKVVMRILDQDKGIKPLSQLGFSKRNLELIQESMKKPYGIILITGPTGSGKTTTLYSMLKELNREENNVVSLEDPIEYNIDSISQSQVRPEIDYTFATGLRSILRQDPDIIMVGEIRDGETARLAIQAALTGHLVLSTLHTNNSIAAIPRLLDMGIEPYLIAPTLNMVIAQRLVGRLCDESKGELPVIGNLKTKIEKQFVDLPDEFKKELKIPDKVYTTAPSGTCSTGTRGRMPVLEVLNVDKEMQNLIFKNPTEEEIKKMARKKGFITMAEDAMLKSFEGTVSFDEVEGL